MKSKYQQPHNSACKLFKTTEEINFLKSRQSGISSLHSASPRHMPTHPKMTSIPLLERMSPCLTNTMPPDKPLPYGDLGPEVPRMEKTRKTLLERLGTRDPDLTPLSDSCQQTSESLTNHSSLGSEMRHMPTHPKMTSIPLLERMSPCL